MLMVIAVLAALVGFASPASAQTTTTTTLAIGPSDPTTIGESVTFTATITPSDVSGTVLFSQGDRPMTGYIPVVDGVASVTLENFATGTADYNAAFFTNDPETWSDSTSQSVDHTVVPGELPVMECEGANDVVKGILAILPPLQASGGVVVIETPIEGHVMDEIPVGPAVPVSFSWSITIPDYLVEIAAEFGAQDYLSVLDIDMAIEASGAATGEWSFPTRYPDEGYIADPYAPIVFTTAGSLTATTEGEVEYTMAPGQMTVFVPHVGTVPAAIDVVLDCNFVNVALPTTTVEGSADVPIFSDVPADHPFYAEINWMSLTGLSTGYEPGPIYQPGLTLTRQAMSAFIYRINGNPNGEDPTCSEAPFNDVPADHPFCGEIAWMKATGISEGYEGNLYKPDDGLTRQAMSAFLYRSANPGETPEPCSTPPFPDVPTSNPFCAEIAWMAETGISVGFDDGARYEPNLALTRQAMSAFLYRYTLVVDVEL